MKELLDMFLTFARIGGFTFGGGYAMLPMLQKEVVNGRHWATDEELMDYYAIGQCTPGIIAVNTATFVGYKNRGIPGAIAATLASRRYEQKIMNGIPFVIVLYLRLGGPGFMDPVYGNIVGVCVMTGCLLLYLGAWYLGRRMLEIEV